MPTETPQQVIEHVARRMVELREKAGLTQADVSAKLKRPQSFVAKYEGGERRLDVIEFLQVCNALGVDPRSILSKLQAKVGE